MDAAKAAASEVVSSIDPETEFALLTYGSTVPEESGDIEAGCRDVTVLQQLGLPDPDSARQAIDDIEATGFTPIGEALRTAGDQLDGEGDRSIILVSDGIDTCAPPPVCEVAEELADEGVGVAIHTVGFRVDDAARTELECIAEVSGGTYSQADDTEELSEQLNAVAQMVATAYEAAGAEFEYGDVYLGEGAYVTQLPGPVAVEGRSGPNDYGESGNFLLAVPDEHTAHVVANLVPPLEPDVPQYFGLHLEATNPTCNTEKSDYESFQPGYQVPKGVHLRITPEDDCDPAEWTIESYRSGTEDASQRQVEYVIGFEPAVDLADSGPEDNVNTYAGNPDVPDLDKNLEISEAAPGYSYSSALPVEPGAYSAAIVPGETHYYRFPVEWGQRLAAQARFDPLDVQDAYAHRVRIDIVPPTRKAILSGLSGSLSSDEDTVFTNTEASYAFYRNQDAPVSAYLKEQAYAGDWYAAVTYDNGDGNGRPAPPVNYDITIVADGAIADGPDWQMPTEAGPEASLEPLSGASETVVTSEPTTTEAEEPTETTAEPADAETDNEVEAQADNEGGVSSLTFGIVVVIAVLLLVVIGVLVALMRRRR